MLVKPRDEWASRTTAGQDADQGDSLFETALQRQFRAYRTHGEWFNFGDLDPVAEVSAAARRLNPTLAGARRRKAQAAQAVKDSRMTSSRRRIIQAGPHWTR